MAFCRLHDRIGFDNKAKAGWTCGLKQVDVVAALHGLAK